VTEVEPSAPWRRPNAWRDQALTAALVLSASLVVALVRAPLFERHRHLRETTDAYILPPPRELVVLSLGYRSALADLLWSHVLVAQGLHAQQKRRYDSVATMLEAILALEPTYREPYLFTDTLITFQMGGTSPEDARRVRAILEMGVANRPLDGEIWLGLGEFVAYVAPGSYLTDPEEQAQWRVAGARFLAHAAELGNDNARWQAMGGAGILTRMGERDAALRFLRRSLAVAEDPELKESLQAHLLHLLGEQRDESFHRVDAKIIAQRRADLPQVSRTLYMLLGPPRDAAACAGPGHEEELACAPSFHAWEELLEQAYRASEAP
jgi:hypothetical protein